MRGVELYHDSFLNWKQHINRKAQLIITDPPYNIGRDAYASNPQWYRDDAKKNGRSRKANQPFFTLDEEFVEHRLMRFCSEVLQEEPTEKGKAPCLVIFCSFEQQFLYIKLGREFGFNKYINLVFRKNNSAEVLKVNMRIVGCCEYGLVLYRDKLPKFNNDGAMILNCFDYVKDTITPRVHPTQKPVGLLERLIQIFTDKGDVVIDPCAGSGTTLLAAGNLKREAYGFEIEKEFYDKAKNTILPCIHPRLFL